MELRNNIFYYNSKRGTLTLYSDDMQGQQLSTGTAISYVDH